MRGIGRISLWLTTLLFFCGIVSVPASADGGRKKSEGRRATAAGALTKPGSTTPRTSPSTAKERRALVVREHARMKVRFSWPRLSWRYQHLVAEGRKQERIIDRSRKRIERDLVHLYQARIYILNASARKDGSERPDPVLVQVVKVRRRVGKAVFVSRSVLSKTLVSVRKTYQRLDREYQPARRANAKATVEGARGSVPVKREWRAAARVKANRKSPNGGPVEAEARKALDRMKRCSQAYFRVANVARNRIEKLARQTRRVTHEVLRKQPVRGDRAKLGKGTTEVRRALGRLERMESTKRRALRLKRLQEARRIQQMEKHIAELKKEVRAMEEKLGRLKKRKQPKPDGPPAPNPGRAH